MDHLSKEVKSDVSANYQYRSVDEHTCCAENNMLGLSSKQARIKAGILSDNFWLKYLL